jgi:hypothetical protein
VQRSGVKLQPDDGEDDDGEQHQQADLEQRSHGLDDGLQHDLQTCGVEGKKKKQKNDVGLHVGTPDGKSVVFSKKKKNNRCLIDSSKFAFDNASPTTRCRHTVYR